MASLRLRKGIYYVVFWWDGRQRIKSLRTDNKAEATRLKEDVEAQLQRIRRGESALASTLLADGHDILDVLFGSEKIGHLIASPTDDNPLTLSELKAAFTDSLKATGRTAGHIEGTQTHLDHFMRVLGDVRVMSLTDADMTAFQNKRGKEKVTKKTVAKKTTTKKKSRKKEKTVSKRLISQGTIRSDFKSLRSAVNWAMTGACR